MIKKILLLAFLVCGSAAMLAQTTITGTVKDAKTSAGELSVIEISSDDALDIKLHGLSL